MDINKKIEEIRKQPEHIRMRYVWSGVFVVMFLIVIIWLFSLQETFRNSVPAPDKSTSPLDQWGNIKENMPSIEDFNNTINQAPSQNEISPQPDTTGNSNIGNQVQQ
jgi:hypothetical protein